MSMPNLIRRLTQSITAAQRNEIKVTADAIDGQFEEARRILRPEDSAVGKDQAWDLINHLNAMQHNFLWQAHKNLRDIPSANLNNAQQALIDAANEIFNMITDTSKLPSRMAIEGRLSLYRKNIAKISNLQYYGTKFLSALFTLGGMIGGFFLGRLGVNAVLPDETPISTGAKVAAVAVPIVGEVVGAVVGGYVANKLADTLFKSDQQLLIEKCMKLADKQTDAHVDNNKFVTAYNHFARLGRFVTS